MMRPGGRVPAHLWDGKIADDLKRITDRGRRRLARELLLCFWSASWSHSTGLFMVARSTMQRHVDMRTRS